MIWRLVLEKVWEALLPKSSLLYSTKCVSRPLILLRCCCSRLFFPPPFRGWSIMALWKMGFIIHCAVWVITSSPRASAPSLNYINSACCCCTGSWTVTSDRNISKISIMCSYAAATRRQYFHAKCIYCHVFVIFKWLHSHREERVNVHSRVLPFLIVLKVLWDGWYNSRAA